MPAVREGGEQDSRRTREATKRNVGRVSVIAERARMPAVREGGEKTVRRTRGGDPSGMWARVGHSGAGKGCPRSEREANSSSPYA